MDCYSRGGQLDRFEADISYNASLGDWTPEATSDEHWRNFALGGISSNRRHSTVLARTRGHGCPDLATIALQKRCENEAVVPSSDTTCFGDRGFVPIKTNSPNSLTLELQTEFSLRDQFFGNEDSSKGVVYAFG